MKKMFFLLMLFATALAYGQNSPTGKWALWLENSTGMYKIQEIKFSSSLPTPHDLWTDASSINVQGAVCGAYSNSYNLMFPLTGPYYLNDYAIPGSTHSVWYTDPAGYPENLLEHDIKVLPLPGSNTKFIVLYFGHTQPVDFRFRYRLAERTAGQWNFGASCTDICFVDRPWNNGSTTQNEFRYSSFRVMPLNSFTHDLYLCTRSGYSSQGGLKGAIMKYQITSQGVNTTNPVVVVDQDNAVINTPDAFHAWDMDVKRTASGDKFAWCTGVASNDITNISNYVFLYVNGIAIKKNLNIGRIVGLAFSETNANVVYAAGATGGVVAYNFAANTVQVLGTNSTYYNHSSLRRAPDGKIYMMHNNGQSLGCINEATNLIDALSGLIPSGFSLGSYVVIDNVKYYILPEEDRTYTQPVLTLNAIGAGLCQTNGSITATVTGGIPPYTFTWEVRTGSTWTLVSTYTGTSTTNTLNGVEAGEMYQCTVTDQAGTVVPQTITVPYTSGVTTGLNTWSGPTTNQTRYFSDGFYVPAGQTLTLTNCTCYFGDEAKVEVQNGVVSGTTITTSGGKLVLNNTTFTVAPGCAMWKGVEVWGHKTFNQYNPNGKCAQGHIVLTNSSEVSYAEVGVLLTSRGTTTTFDPNKTGGIIQAENNGNPNAPHRFRNNRYGVLFWTYHNMLQGSENDNRSYLKNCLFDVNPSYLIGNSWTEAHVYMFDVKGITLSGNTFSYSLTGSPSGHGINAYHAGFKVESLFNNSVEDKSYFTNFAKGINCIETVSDYNLMAYKAVFNNNSRGIALDRSHNAKILFNTFNIGKPAILDESLCEDGTGSAYGIDVENSIGFLIEENQFTKAANTPPGTYTGIAAFSCPSPLDIIYKNTFTNLNYGNYAWGINRSNRINDRTGIRYECNYNTGNGTDFCVTGDTAMINGKIAHQLTETVYTASGNSFSATAQWHFRNEGTQDIRYHHFGTGVQYPLPSKVYVLSAGDFFYWISAPENTCASHFGGGSGSGSTDLLMSASERSQTEQQYAQNAADFASVETMFTNLKDGGDTPGTLADIEYAWPDNMWQLVTDLLTKSPYLSEEVLIEVAGRTDVVPQSALFDILAANPDELKKSSLMTFLKEMENPLPDYMIALLEQIAANTTPKTALLNQMELYHSQMTTAAQRLISNELLDSITDYNYVRTWLRKFNSADFDQQVALSFLSEGKIDSAYAVLDTIAVKYNLQEADLAEFNQFRSLLELQVQVKAAGRTVFDLDSTELSLVQNAAGGTGNAASYARNILEMGYNTQYCNCVSTNTILTPKRGSVNDFNEKLPELNISASPNPATTWVAFDYTLPEGVRSATLTITDSQGKAVESFDVTGRQGQKLWDTRHTGSGFYFYTLRAAQLSRSGKIVVR